MKQIMRQIVVMKAPTLVASINNGKLWHERVNDLLLITCFVDLFLSDPVDSWKMDQTKYLYF